MLTLSLSETAEPRRPHMMHRVMTAIIVFYQEQEYQRLLPLAEAVGQRLTLHSMKAKMVAVAVAAVMAGLAALVLGVKDMTEVLALMHHQHTAQAEEAAQEQLEQTARHLSAETAELESKAT